MVAGIKSGSHRGEGSQGPGGGVVTTPQRNAPGRSVSLKAGGGASRDATWEGLKQRSLLKQPTENKASLLPPHRAWRAQRQSIWLPEALEEAPGNLPLKACCSLLPNPALPGGATKEVAGGVSAGSWGGGLRDSLVSGASGSRGGC